MKKIKISSLLILFLGIICVCSASANAYTSSNVINKDNYETQDLLGGVTMHRNSCQTYYNGITDAKHPAYALNNQVVQWVDIPSGSDIKTVVWSEGTKHGFGAATTTSTAKNFEEENPGWIVVAGINGDWFDINGTKQPVNMHMQEGELYKAYNTGSNDLSVLGFMEDSKLIVGKPTISNKMHLEIIENNKVKEFVEISTCNNTPSETGITLLTKDIIDNVDLTGFKVYVGEYDICRVTNEQKRVFVKGTITGVQNDLGITKPDKGFFYLASKDGSLDDLIATDTYVRCQYVLEGAWNKVKNTMGYVYPVLLNGISQYEKSYEYNKGAEFTVIKPRSIIGFKEDGSTVIMGVDGRLYQEGRVGISCYEAGELIKETGCVNAYNLDGGGSATLIVRNQLGGFDILNTPSDGSERGIGNAILFVMRDPMISIDYSSITRTSLKVIVDASNALQLGFREVKVTVNDVEKVVDFTNPISGMAAVEFTGLDEKTKYQVKVTYKTKAYYDETKIVPGSTYLYAETKAFEMPNPGLEVTGVTDTSIKITKKDYSTSSWIKDVIVHVGDQTYNMNDLTEFEVTGLFKDTEYSIYFEYKVLDPETNNEYAGVTEEIKVSTLDFTVPEVTQFEESRVNGNEYTFRYRYKDEDDVITRAYVLVNETKYELDSTSGSVTITLDRYASKYNLTLVLEFLANGQTEKVESAAIMYELLIKEEKKGCKKDLSGTLLTSVSVLTLAMYLLRKKY